MSNQVIDTLWVSKYRPQQISDICLPKSLKKRFEKSEVDSHLLFGGKPGTGKTTLARILCKNHTTKYFNGSDERKIDVIRKQVIDFCSSVSLLNSDKSKVVFFEEAEKLTRDAQDALKAVIEKFENHVKFVFTSNHPERLNDALISRFEYIDFDKFDEAEIKDLKIQYGRRILHIVENENFKIDHDAMKFLINNVFPDMRKITGLLYASTKLCDDSKTITLQMLRQENVISDEALYDFLLNEKRPEKIYAYVKGRFDGKELDALKSLGSDFLEYLQKTKHSGKVLHIAAIMHKYNYEATTGDVDTMLTLLAATSAISQLCK